MSDEHYFTADPSVPFEREPFSCEVWGHELTLTSGAGRLQPQGHLDHATAVLFRETEPPAPGRVLDLGCGYGVIGLAIAARRTAGAVSPPSTSTSGRCCWPTRTPRALGRRRTGSSRCRPDEVPADATYDEIWSNPPIRIGKEALHELLLTWLPRLAPGGRAVMVVGKNLGADSLQRWLAEQGCPTERLASAKGFRVLETRRPAG